MAFNCALCDRSFETQRGLNSHSKRSHRDDTVGSTTSTNSIDTIESTQSITSNNSQDNNNQPADESAFTSGIQTTVQSTRDLSSSKYSNNTNINEGDEQKSCPLCKEDIVEGQNGIRCDACHVWSHKTCLNMSDEEFSNLSQTSHEAEAGWFCARCLSIKANKINWGELEGEQAIRSAIDTIYNEILDWKKNIFPIPRGKCGNDLIKELTRLIQLFVRDTEWQRLSLALVHIFLPIMLQKPSAKSKPRDNARYLTTRLQRWSEGQQELIMKECLERLKRSKKKEEAREKAIGRLMMLGKIVQAVKTTMT